MRNPNRSPKRQGKGFTLLELIVVIAIVLVLAVILIVVVMSVLGSNKERTTTNRLEIISGVLERDQNLQFNLISPARGVSGFSDAFQGAVKANSNDWRALSFEERARLLAYYCGPTKESFDKSNVEAQAYSPGVDAATAKEMIRDMGGFSTYLDAWDTPEMPISYLVRPAAGEENPIVLVSAGEDRKFLTEDDVYWSKKEGTMRGNPAKALKIDVSAASSDEDE